MQLSRGAGESLRKRLREHSLDRDHLHFLGTLIDCPSNCAKLKDQIGTVDLKNLGVISFQQLEQLIRGFWVNSGASIGLINHCAESRRYATVLSQKTPDKSWGFEDPRSRCHNQCSLRSPFTTTFRCADLPAQVPLLARSLRRIATGRNQKSGRKLAQKDSVWEERLIAGHQKGGT